uniref:Retrotransposable element Tf2 n=1 Tax=Cajanus cajan TaxID=3821 RepID=A0A151TQQ0_CAJCA|nr:Retrotransposable element Tf2 [Cajanus cajan]
MAPVSSTSPTLDSPCSVHPIQSSPFPTSLSTTLPSPVSSFRFTSPSPFPTVPSLEFAEGEHVFLKVTPTSGVGRALKARKLTPIFVGPYQIIHRVGPVAYRLALPPSLSNLHDVFHVSQLRKYVHDPSHVVELDDVQVKENLTYEKLPVAVVDHKLKELRGKFIPLVKVLWDAATGEATWEVE